MTRILKNTPWFSMSKMVEKNYDFIHITPPQKASDLVGKSPIGSSKGWVPVVKETLQHVTYTRMSLLLEILRRFLWAKQVVVHVNNMQCSSRKFNCCYGETRKTYLLLTMVIPYVL